MSEEHTNGLTHVRDGKPMMVDVSGKAAGRRVALARVKVELGSEVMAKFSGGDLVGPKGSVVQTAIIAGTMAVKRTWELIPFCHPLPVEHCHFDVREDGDGLLVDCEVATTGKTGVEMEAMTGVMVAALTIYDMCKALNKGIRIEGARLVSKTGGKSGDYFSE